MKKAYVLFLGRAKKKKGTYKKNVAYNKRPKQPRHSKYLINFFMTPLNIISLRATYRRASKMNSLQQKNNERKK